MNRTAYVPLGGGIDLVTPPRQLKPGQCLYAVNYECPVSGGYRRIGGYLQIGATLPGNGPVLGVVTFQGDYYAIRDNGTDATLYKFDGASWVSVGNVPSGRYEFAVGNFLATAAGEALYMVGGGKPYELKGGTLTELTGAQAGATFIAVHNNRLFLGFKPGSLQYSVVGDPTDWAGANGAGEIGTQGELTGLLNGTGGTLHVMGRDHIKTLYGFSSADFELRTTVPNSGARPYSAQNMIQPYFVSERGIASLKSSQDFGDFSQLQVGAAMEPLFADAGFANLVVCSSISKRRAQYRVFFSDGSGVYLSPAGPTTVSFPDKPQVMHAAELDTGEEVVLFGDDAGNVYRLGNGENSFNGQAIPAFLTLAYTDLNKPSVIKRFRRVFWDIRSGSGASITFRADRDYGQANDAVNLRQTLTFLLGGGLWDADQWDNFTWSGPVIAEEAGDLNGSGTAINFAIYSNDISDTHEILGYDITYTERRQRRG